MVAGFDGQQRRQVFGPMVGLEIGRLVRDVGVGCRMRLGKAIARELDDQVEYIARLARFDSVARAAVDETIPLELHLLGLFLPHGAPQNIRLAEAVGRHLLCDLEYLVLVDDHSQRLFRQVLDTRMKGLDPHAAILAIDEIIDHSRLQGAGTVERHQLDDLAESSGPCLDDQFRHA